MLTKTFDLDWYQRRYGLFVEGDGDAGAGGAAAGATGDGATTATAGAAAGPAATGAAATAGAGAATWRESITDPDAKKLAETSTDLNHFAKRTLEMRQKLSTAIVVPGKDAKPEEMADYRKKIGVPDAVDGYVFTDPEGYQPTDADKALRGKFAEAFHANNVPVETAQALAAVHNQIMAEEIQAIKAADEKYARESKEALDREWGADREANRTFADRAAKDLLGTDYEAARKLEDKTGRFVFDNPILQKMLAKVGREMGEDRIGTVVSDSDRGALNDQVRDLRTKQAEAQSKGDSRRANELYQEEQALLARLNGNQPVVGARGRAA